MMRELGIASFVSILSAATPGLAQDVNLTEDNPSVSFSLNGHNITVARIQDQSHQLRGDYTLTSRACPPACIQPMRAARGVETLGELELLKFLERSVSSGTGILIDARMPGAFASAAIPGAVNVPTTTVAPDNPYRPDILRALGAAPQSGGRFEFSGALDLVVYGEGPWNSAASEMIGHLLSAGYPADKVYYYRGGMQGWVTLGLTTARPQSQG